jgi:transposase
VQQYVALDVSKQSSEAVIVDETGNRLVSRKVATDPQALAAFVAKYGESVALVGFEAGPLSTWLYHELTGAGLPEVCIDSWRARAALSARLNKTDRTDAAGLADLLRAGFHHEVHVKSYAAHEVRTMLKARDSLVAQRRTLQNTIRGLLETFGLILRRGSGGRFAVLVEDALDSRPSLRPAIEPLLAIWHAAREAAAAMHRRLRAMASANADCRRLMTTPGVGPIRRGAAGTPRPRMGAGFHERHRRSGALSRQPCRRRLFWPDAETVPVRQIRPCRQDLARR